MEALVEVAKTSSSDDELNLSLGDVITNVVQIDNTWYKGQLHGKKGRFREEFVKLIVKDSSKTPLTDDESKVIRRDEKKRKAVKALFSYAPTNNDELELQVHDIIEVIEETEEFWWKGILKGSIGMFPSNFVTEVNVESHDSTALVGESALKQTGNRNSHIIPANVSASPPSQKEIKQKLTNSTCDDETTQSNSSSNEKRQYFQSSAIVKKTSVNSSCDAPQLPPKPVREQAKVLYPYEAQNEDELSLREGDIITVISKEVEDKGWWRGELNNQIGVFPDNFVELVKSEEVVQKKPERPDKPVIRPVPSKGSSSIEFQEKVATAVLATSKKVSKTPPAKPPPPEINKKVDEKPDRPLLPHSVRKPQVPPPMKKPVRSSLGMRFPSSSSTSSASNSISSPVADSPPPLMSHNSPSAFTYKNTSQLSSPESSVKPQIVNEAGDMKDSHEFDLLEVSTDKLLHVTANRVKFPNRRPPSHLFLKENEKENGVKEECKSLIKDLDERQSKTKFQMKETQSKELKVCKPVPISSHEEKPKVPPYRPALPAQIKANIAKVSKPEPSNVSQPALPHIVQTSTPHIPSSESSATKVAKKVKEDVVDAPKEQNTFQLELSELKNEMRKLKESMVPRTEYEKLISQVHMLKECLEMHKDQYKKQICSLKTELEEEKKFRLSMQKGIDK